jgi:hypothetical protein
LRRIDEGLREAGAEPVVIGSGTPEQARHFREETGLRASVLCDPARRSYALARMKRGLLRSVGPRSALYAVGSLLRGHLPGRTQGDATQQGGALVVTREGRVVYAHQNEVAGEPLRAEDLLAAARAAAGPATA